MAEPDMYYVHISEWSFDVQSPPEVDPLSLPEPHRKNSLSLEPLRLPPSHLAPSLLSLLGLLAVGVCCCWSNDGGSGMRISNRGCRRRPRWNRFGQRSFPRSALVVTQSFALREAMATRTIRLRSWWCDKRRAKARKPGSVVKRRPVSLALTWDRGEPQDPWPGWIQL